MGVPANHPNGSPLQPPPTGGGFDCLRTCLLAGVDLLLTLLLTLLFPSASERCFPVGVDFQFPSVCDF